MKPYELTQKIKAYALEELKFNLVGVAQATALPQEYEHLLQWCQLGYNAELEWFKQSLTVRTQPDRLLKNCRSIIVVAASYYVDLTEKKNDWPYATSSLRLAQENSRVLIARYGWVTDYHRVIKERLKLLSNYISTLEPTSKCYISVDAEPVLEKYWAVQAGIGWQGKNSIIINPELGSWFCLGLILTDIELAYSTPMANQCGDCSNCIKACPTQAIVADRVVNASRCISYLNIEAPRLNRQPAPLTLYGWGFGCDICQEVCPYNQHRKATVTFEGFELIPEAVDPPSEYWEQLNATPQIYQEVYKRCPLLRRRL